MDPQLRKLLEVTHEAWVDSGVDVKQLRGSDRVRCRRPHAPCGHASTPLARTAATPASEWLRAAYGIWVARLCVSAPRLQAAACLLCSSAHAHASWLTWLGAGAQVGVYLGCCGSEVHALWLGDINNITGYEQTGCVMSMFANRLSFTYDFKGPSKAVDTGARTGLIQTFVSLCLSASACAGNLAQVNCKRKVTYVHMSACCGRRRRQDSEGSP